MPVVSPLSKVVNMAAPVNWADSLNRGLVAWWKVLLQSARGIAWGDIVRGSHATNVTSNGGKWAGGGPQGFGAVEFNGSTNFVNFVGGTPSAVQKLADNHFLWSCWHYPRSMGEGSLGTLWDNYLNGAYGVAFLLRTAGSNTQSLQVSIDMSTTDVLQITVDNTVTLNVWQHFAYAYNSVAKRGTLYVNGQLVSLHTDTAGVGTVGSDAGTDLRIGNIRAGDTRTYDGFIDDIEVRRGELWTDAHVFRLYLESRQRYPSTLNYLSRTYYSVPAAVGGRTTYNTRSHPLGIQAGHPRRVIVNT